jgi:hypothetical protein
MIAGIDRQAAKESLFERKSDAIVVAKNANRRSEKMHPATASITIRAHVRDLQRAMHPERSLRERLGAWIRRSR